MAIDIDENEDITLISDTWEERGLTEPVALSPQELTEQLISAFGPEVVTPPRAPIVLISADQTSARLLPGGLKEADEISAAIAEVR